VTNQPQPLQGSERALLDSEIRLQQVLDNSSAIVFAKDRLGRYLFVNREFERVTGRGAATALGHTDDEVFPAELAARFRHNDLRVLQQNRAIEFEEVADFGGGSRTFLSSKFPLLDSAGAAYAVCCMATDITERKRLEDAFSAAALAVSQSEEETLYRQLARYLCAILGVDGAFIATLVPDRPGQMRMLAFHLDGEVRENFDYPLTGTPCATVVSHGFQYYPDRLGELFTLDPDFHFTGYAGQPLVDGGGGALGVIAAVSRRPLDNPPMVEGALRIFAVRVNAELERAAAEDALRASEEQYRTIFNASVDGLLLKDENHRIVDVNAAYLAMHGFQRDALIGRRLSQFIPSELQQRCDVLLPEILAGQPCHFEAQTRRGDGTALDVEIRGVPMQYRGRPHALVVMRDITEAKRIEASRAGLAAQLRQAQKMEAIGQLTGGIAHDFNNLLTSIMGYIALAGERESAVEDRRLGGYLAQAQRSCERARDLIQQMLMFSRGHRGSRRTVGLASLVQETLPTLQAGLPGTLELVVKTDGTAAPVLVDPIQVEQVLLNLCINSRDAMTGTGTIRIGVRPAREGTFLCSGCRRSIDGQFVELFVADDGHGMDPEVLERIFEPFFSTKEVGKGSGMGLAMVHGIVHEHGGHVVVESSLGKGAMFRILWPAVPEGAATAQSRQNVAALRPPQAALSGSVLVVDDEETVGEFMRELLESWGLQAVFASRAAAALELVREAPHRFNAVITDQSMPRMTGLELARRLHELRGSLPVILYTGFGDGLAESDASLARLCAVIPKPVDPALLREILVKCMSAPASDRQSATVVRPSAGATIRD
jgi:PAS domain S-box-containing protein